MTEDYITLDKLAGTLSGRAFIVGNGPSLNDLDMTKLKDEPNVFGSNRVYLGYENWGLQFPYWCIEDTRVANDTKEEWNQVPAKVKFIPYDLRHHVSNWDNICLVNFNRKGHRLIAGRTVFWPKFSLTPDTIYHGMTVTYLMIQIAFILGCDPLYLIGVDHYYKRTDDIHDVQGPGRLISSGDDPDHFDPNYFGKGRHYHVPRTDLSTNSYRVAELTAIENDLEIYNASARTKLDVFERVDYDSLF